ncbi:MAG: DUF2254 domain-containing protein [Fimbriimonas sp.]|nr:DUF2254 domain-containing protein [Fimbriimonas sp.]
MIKRLPLLYRHVLYNLRGGFLVRPLIITLALGICGGLLSQMENAMPWLSGWAPRWLFPSHIDFQVAQIILSSIATSVMTVVSIVFAILLMTLTLASMQFSPRIIVSFAQDRVTQWTLGIFLGTFSYCIAALPAAHNYPKSFEPVVTVMGGMLLATMCVAWLLFFIHHISQAISVNHIVDRIASETVAMIMELMPDPVRRHKWSSEDLPSPPSTGEAVMCPASGYIRFVDTARLVELATQHRFAIYVLRRVGHFVPEGVPLIVVSKEGRMTPELATELGASFDIGPSRTLQQDVEFGILQIVDIALKAISPAVNDPTTAITCVDQLSRILICFAGRQSLEEGYYNPPGVLRVAVPRHELDKLVDSAFEQIRSYATRDVVVSLRVIRALNDIGTTIHDSEIRKVLAERGRRVVDGVAKELGEDTAKDLRLRQAMIDALVAKA